MKNCKLRDYQEEASAAIFREWETNQSTLVVMATGLGKTVVCANALAKRGGKSLVVAHREELIWQARDTIESSTDLKCSIEMADSWAPHDAMLIPHDVVVATVQTLNANGGGGRKRMGRFNPRDFTSLVVDEVHHGTAITYRNVVNYFTQNTNLKVLGLTATPDRYDEEALGQIFNSVAYEFDILDGIHHGWLVPIEQMAVNVSGLDFSHISVTAGDLNQGQLAAVMESEKIVQRVVQPTLEAVYGLPEHELNRISVPDWSAYLATLNRKPKQTLVFTVSVKQAEMLANIFSRVIPGLANWVCGETNKDTRRDMLRDYQSGKFPIIVNCDCLSEGWDSPIVEIVVQARPTCSRAKSAQQIGRGTRPLPGIVDTLHTIEERLLGIAASPKPKLLVMDFVGNSGRHKLITALDVLGGKISDSVLERALIRMKALGKPGRVSQIVDQVQKEDEEEKRKQREAARLAEESRKAKLVGKAQFKTQFIDPFSTFGMSPVKMRGWDTGKQLTEKQRALLTRNGFNPDMPYEQAKQTINEMFRRWDKKLATAKQCKWLRSYGYDPTNMTMAQASEILDAKWGKKKQGQLV